MPKLEYPAFFEGDLLGVRAKEQINHRDMILSIPYKVLISLDKCLEDPVLGRVFKENPALFGEDENPDWEQLTLCVFLMFEHQKGEKSFWWPYLNLMPDVKFFCDWDD